MWYRVFGTSPMELSPAGLLEHLQQLGIAVATNFKGDDDGWFRAELVMELAGDAVLLERYLVSEEGIRGELNNWAAWIESTGDGPMQTQLMQHMIGTQQLFTVRPPENATDPEKASRLCLDVCRYVARETGGVYQVDGQGFFAPGGEWLLKE
jgi:hypothetical protein